jgi:cytochrome P450
MDEITLADVPITPGANALGHAHLFKEARIPFYRSIANQGPFARVKFVRRDVVFANTPAVAHEILVEKARSFEKSPGIKLLLHYLGGQGLFTSEGELWRRQRRLMAPLFVPNAIGAYATAMHEVTTRAIGGLRDGDRVDLLREATRITMGVVGKVLFDDDLLHAEADELGEALTVSLKWVDRNAGASALLVHIAALDAIDGLASAVGPRLHPRLRAIFEEPFLLPGARSSGLRAAIARIDRKIQALIEERRAPSARPRRDLLARLLAARDGDDPSFRGMSDKQIRDEAVTLFLAGHETTATSLAWTFYLLARNPEWRARVQAEIDALPEGPLDFAKASRLDVTLRVFKEAMRLYPPVEVLARRAIEPVRIGPLKVPARGIVFTSPWIVHRDPQTWPDPERFDPDRFLPAAEARRPRSAWLPFGAGPRVCIGNHFAMLEGPIVLATLMRAARFEIDANRTIEPEAFATLRPRGGVPATVRIRTQEGANAERRVS